MVRNPVDSVNAAALVIASDYQRQPNQMSRGRQ
jgi:hypothetical protein